MSQEALQRYIKISRKIKRLMNNNPTDLRTVTIVSTRGANHPGALTAFYCAILKSLREKSEDCVSCIKTVV